MSIRAIFGYTFGSTSALNHENPSRSNYVRFRQYMTQKPWRYESPGSLYTTYRTLYFECESYHERVLAHNSVIYKSRIPNT